MENFVEKMRQKNMRVTPQRIAVLEALATLHNHPTAEQVLAVVQQKMEGVSLASVYNILDSLVENGLVKKVNTERDVMRYDGFTHAHHHLYEVNTARIEDYSDPELNDMLNDYFRQKQIPGFKIKDIRLNLIGSFENQ